MNFSKSLVRNCQRAWSLVVGAIVLASLFPEIAEAVPPRVFFRSQRRAMRREATVPARPPASVRPQSAVPGEASPESARVAAPRPQLMPFPETGRPQAVAVPQPEKKASAEVVQRAGYEASPGDRSNTPAQVQSKPQSKSEPQPQQSKSPAANEVAADGTVSVLVRQPDASPAARAQATPVPADAPLVFPDAAGTGQGR